MVVKPTPSHCCGKWVDIAVSYRCVTNLLKSQQLNNNQRLSLPHPLASWGLGDLVWAWLGTSSSHGRSMTQLGTSSSHGSSMTQLGTSSCPCRSMTWLGTSSCHCRSMTWLGSSAPHGSQVFAPAVSWGMIFSGGWPRLKSVNRNIQGRPRVGSATLSLLSTCYWPKQVTWPGSSPITNPKSHGKGVDAERSE